MATNGAARELQCIVPVFLPATLPDGRRAFRIRAAGNGGKEEDMDAAAESGDGAPCGAGEREEADVKRLPEWARVLLAAAVALVSCLLIAKAAMMGRGYPAVGSEALLPVLAGAAAYAALGHRRHEKASRC